MGEIKQINLKNRTYYFYKDIIDLRDFHAKLFKIDKKSYKNTDIYYIGYITIKKLMIMRVFIVWILCICILVMRVDILKKKMEIIFDSVDEKKEVLKKYANGCNEIKNKIKVMNGDECDYEEDYIKI